MSSNQTKKFNSENQINAKNESLENKTAPTGSTSSNEMIPEVESQEIDEFFDAQDFVSKSSPSNLQEDSDSDSESVESFHTATESEYVEEIWIRRAQWQWGSSTTFTLKLQFEAGLTD